MYHCLTPYEVKIWHQVRASVKLYKVRQGVFVPFTCMSTAVARFWWLHRLSRTLGGLKAPAIPHTVARALLPAGWLYHSHKLQHQ